MGLPAPKAARSRYQTALLLLDLVWGGLALLLAWRLLPEQAPDLTGSWTRAAPALLPPAWCLAVYLWGQYYLRPWRPGLLTAVDVFMAVTAGTAAVIGGSYLLAPQALAGRGFYLLAGLGMWGPAVLSRLAAMTFLPRAAFMERYLLLGTGPRAEGMAEVLRNGGGAGAELLGAVSLDGERAALPVVGHGRDLPRLIDELSPTHAVLCSAGGNGEIVARAVAECELRGLRVETMPRAYERVTGQAPLFAAGAEWLSGIEARPRTRYATRLKRVVDLVVSALVLPPALLLMGLGALAIRLTSPGPVLYVQSRVGRGGRPFAFVKLRTMVHNAERGTGPVWARPGDPRITPVGCWLRRTGIDELPQLWSVLRGEMSLVGPRPERPHFVARFSERIPYYRLRLLVPPGITGWAQVHQGADQTEQDVQGKLGYDLYYVRHLSFALDLQVLGRTLGVLIHGPAAQRSRQV